MKESLLHYFTPALGIYSTDSIEINALLDYALLSVSVPLPFICQQCQTATHDQPLNSLVCRYMICGQIPE